MTKGGFVIFENILKFEHPFSKILQVCAFVLVLAGCCLALLQGAESLGYTWHWHRIPRYLIQVSASGWRAGPLLQGLWLTLAISVVSLVVTLLIGLVSALMRLSGGIMATALARIYLEVIRNTPLLVQIFLIYFVLAPILGFGRLSSAVIALSLFEGAYASEIIRAGILAIGRGQWEAGAALGLTRAGTYRHIILPQALRQMIPPLTSQGISLIKDSALVSTIAIYDLTMQGQQIIAESFLTFEVWFSVAAIYLLVTIVLSILVKFLEYRMATYLN